VLLNTIVGIINSSGVHIPSGNTPGGNFPGDNALGGNFPGNSLSGPQDLSDAFDLIRQVYSGQSLCFFLGLFQVDVDVGIASSSFHSDRKYTFHRTGVGHKLFKSLMRNANLQ